MIGIVILTHGLFGEELHRSAEMIVGRQDKVDIISLESGFALNEIALRLEDIININGSEGSLVFTDMFGGSPSNISMAYLNSDSVEVVSGVNLPMLIKAYTMRMDKSSKLSNIAQEAAVAARESVKVAGDYLRKANAG